MGANGCAGGGANGRHPARVACSLVLLLLSDGVRIARCSKAEGIERIDTGDRYFVSRSPEEFRHTICDRGPDAVSHLRRIAENPDTSFGINLDPAEGAVGAGAVVLGTYGNAGADQLACGGGLSHLHALAPDSVIFKLVENLRRAH